MPTYKPELTSKEQAKYLSIARELEAAGTRVDIPDGWQQNARFLRVTIAGSPESILTQLSPSGPGRLFVLPRGAHCLSIWLWTRF